MRSMVVGLTNNTSIAMLSIVSKYVKPSTASGSPPFSREDIRSYSIVNSINSRKASPLQTVIYFAQISYPFLLIYANFIHQA